MLVITACGKESHERGPHESLVDPAILSELGLDGAKLVAIRHESSLRSSALETVEKLPLPASVSGAIRRQLRSGLTDKVSLVRIDLVSGHTTVLQTFPEAKRFEGLSRPAWSPDGSAIVYSFGGKGFRWREGETRQILEGERVYSPSYWVDPATREACFVYTDIHGKHVWDQDRNVGKTYLACQASGRKEILADFPFDGGLSPDGTHLGEGYAGALIKDLRSGDVSVLYGGKQACNASISPDDTHRLMHLYLPHTTIGIRNKWDRELWTMQSPEGSLEWEDPSFSNHPDLAIATAKYGDSYRIAIIQIEAKRPLVLHHVEGNWGKPSLWVPPETITGFQSPGPLQNVPLHRLELYRQRVNQADDYSPILSELENIDDTEAEQISSALLAWAESAYASAGAATNTLEAKAIYREISARFATHRMGREAREILASPNFQQEISAAPEFRRLLALEQRLREVPGRPQRCDDPQYFEHNKALLEQMTELTDGLRTQFPQSHAAARAQHLADRFALGPNCKRVDAGQLVVVATLEDSPAPRSVQQVAPYTEYITFARYRIDEVVSGTYEGSEILVGFWGMRDARHTATAFWPKGIRHRLRLDFFDSHPEFEEVLQQADVDDGSLTPYWAVEISNK